MTKQSIFKKQPKTLEDYITPYQPPHKRHHFRLTTSDVEDIRKLYKEGKTLRECAEKYNVAITTIHHWICTKRNPRPWVSSSYIKKTT
jgi:DNA invertase Pin-like site-specific DNA recombinase